jgi:hypothetical protein
MFILGLLLPICYIPGYTGASIPTQWAVLSLTLPFILHYAFISRVWLGFIAFAILGTLWAPQVYDSIFGIWVVVLWGLSFQLGQSSEDSTSLYKGLAYGLSVSSFIAIFQWFGYTPLPVAYGNNVAGLLYNRTVLSAASALLILCLIEHRLWLYIPSLLPGLILSGSRGGWVVLICAIAARIHWSLVIAQLILVALIFGTSASSSDTERSLIWASAIHGLNWLGWSANSFIGIYVLTPHSLIHPEFVHNDYLQLGFEFGSASLFLFSIPILSLVWRPTLAVFGFIILATFYFPLYTPLTAFICCFALGHSLRGFSPSGLIIRHCRPDLLPWAYDPRPEYDPAWRSTLSIQPRTS